MTNESLGEARSVISEALLLPFSIMSAFCPFAIARTGGAGASPSGPPAKPPSSPAPGPVFGPETVYWGPVPSSSAAGWGPMPDAGS